MLKPESTSEGRAMHAITMEGVRVKGAFVSAFSNALKKLGFYGGVIERASERTREALTTPPPSSVWVDYGICVEVYLIVEQLRGRSAVRALVREATLSGIAPYMQIFVQGMMRLFGVSPATLFTHMTKISGQTSRGAEFTYVPSTESSGVLTCTLPSMRDVNPMVWFASAGGLEIVFETCGVIGTVQDPIYKTDGPNNKAEFRLSWRSRRSAPDPR
jgi:hypothetical protein